LTKLFIFRTALYISVAARLMHAAGDIQYLTMLVRRNYILWHLWHPLRGIEALNGPGTGSNNQTASMLKSIKTHIVGKNVVPMRGAAI